MRIEAERFSEAVARAARERSEQERKTLRCIAERPHCAADVLMVGAAIRGPGSLA